MKAMQLCKDFAEIRIIGYFSAVHSIRNKGCGRFKEATSPVLK
jgi:hypothetical protein